MKRTVTALADGRELIYFDSADRPGRGAADTRELAGSRTQPELRYDRALDEWVIVATHRQARTHRPSAGDCPLCPTRPGHPSEIPAASYEVAVFENRFAALSSPADRESSTTAADPHGLRRPAVGRCEVVCFTEDHDGSFATLAPERAGLVVEAWIDRTRELTALDGVEQVFCFENHGAEIGVTLDHPHGQIYAYPFVTTRTRRMHNAARRYASETGLNLADELLADELRDGTRIVARNDTWTAFVPFAARWPYEVHLYPGRRVPVLAELSGRERAGFAELYLDVLRRFASVFDEPAPYISAVHQAPPLAEEHLALHVEVFSPRRSETKLKFLAGSEAAMEAFANDVSPEAAALRLRAAG